MIQKLLHNLSPTIAETVKCEVTMVLDRLTIPALQNEQQALPAPIEAEIVSPGDAHMTVAKLEVNNYERVKSYLADHPKATLHEIAGALTISVTTANTWRGKIRAESNQGKRKKARSL